MDCSIQAAHIECRRSGGGNGPGPWRASQPGMDETRKIVRSSISDAGNLAAWWSPRRQMCIPLVVRANTLLTGKETGNSSIFDRLRENRLRFQMRFQFVTRNSLLIRAGKYFA
jgi:hypothetical protein